MTHALVTGGSGFFGGILKRRLLSEGVHVFNIDLQDDEDTHPLLTLSGATSGMSRRSTVSSTSIGSTLFSTAPRYSPTQSKINGSFGPRMFTGRASSPKRRERPVSRT